MATTPQTPPDQAQTSMVPPAEDDQDQQDDGYEICIKVSSDGSISVGVESPDDEEDEEDEEGQGGQGTEEGGEGEDGEDGDDEDYQPVQSIGDALKLVREIYANNGQMSQAGQDQADFASGLKQG